MTTMVNTRPNFTIFNMCAKGAPIIKKSLSGSNMTDYGAHNDTVTTNAFIYCNQQCNIFLIQY